MNPIIHLLFTAPLPLFKDLKKNKKKTLTFVNSHFKNDLIASGFLMCWFIMADTCINKSPILVDQLIRLRRITTEPVVGLIQFVSLRSFRKLL